MKSRLLPIARVSEILGVPQSRVYELIRLKLLPAVHLGRNVRVDEDTLDKWIQQGGKSLPGGWRK